MAENKFLILRKKILDISNLLRKERLPQDFNKSFAMTIPVITRTYLFLVITRTFRSVVIPPCLSKISLIITIILTALFQPLFANANPWLPELGGWKYIIQYSKHTTPKTIKFYERDLYFFLSQEKAFLYDNLSKFNNQIASEINKVESKLLILNSAKLANLNAQNKQNAINQIYDNNLDLQILYNRRNNMINETNGNISNIQKVQQNLITHYQKWSGSSSIEYGFNDYISYGIGGNITKEVSKLNTSKQSNNFSIFFKNKLYDSGGYVFTIQPKFLTICEINGLDLTVMLGKSHKIKKPLFGKSVGFFGYSNFGITKFLNSNAHQMHAEITSGIKWNESTIFINQESEDFTPSFNKTYKRVLRSQFTVAQDLNFASIEPRSKIYLNFNYFTIDSIKARRRLSSGYSIGLWIEL